MIKIFRPYLPKKSMVGPKINFNAQGYDAIPPTSAIVEIEISKSVKNKTSTTVVNAIINPSEKYKRPNKIYFKEGSLSRSSMG